ncbi:MAG: hypothetical protein CM15mP40_12640 [Alphaproteobacteria bacterium]|nr:MAG: hypothetical protein CM15mP40_12640 [Alphaproteobacteria bacterium]
MKKLIIFIYFFGFSLSSEDFCVIHNILEKNKKILNCNDKQLLFGYIKFKSKQNNLKYSFNKEVKEYVPHRYKSEILTFVRNNCYKKSLKIKTITNFNSKLDEYINEIIIECRFKL